SFTDNTFPWLAVSLGVLVVTASAIGITGCIKESKYLIGSYTGVLALLVLLQIATVIIAWLQPEGTLVDRFRNEWQHLYVNDPKMLKRLEKANMCCGFSTPADFALPTDCSVNKKFGFTQGCLQPLLNNWNRTRGCVLAAGIILVVIQMLALSVGTEMIRRYKLDDRAPSDREHNSETSPLLA
ncbi:hypothetical protein DL89DRAFT_270371, partial [Linderina pennispora]